MPEPTEGESNKDFDTVAKGVIGEIKKTGEDMKASYNELQVRYEELKGLITESEKNSDSLLAGRIEKLSADILARQQVSDVTSAARDTKLTERDTEYTKRMDSIEVAMQRLPKGSVSGEVTEEMKNAVIFKTNSLAAQGKLTDVGIDEANVEEFKAYKKSFNAYLRRFNPQLQSLTPDETRDLSVGVDPDGGFTVTPFMSTKITQRIFEIDPIRQLARIETISTDAFEEWVNFDEAGAGWANELVANAATTTPTWQLKRVVAHILEARPRASEKLIQDSSVNIESWLAGKVAEKFGRTEAAAFVSGDGVNKPRGLLTYPTVAIPGTPEFGKIEQINMGAAATLTTIGLIDVQYSLVEGVMSRATWLANRLAVRDLMKLKDGDGLFVWRPGLIQGQPATLLGQSIRMSTTMPVVGANTLSIAFADWADAYLIVDRLGISVQRDPFTVKPQIEFFTRKRVGGDIFGYDKIVIGKVAV